MTSRELTIRAAILSSYIEHRVKEIAEAEEARSRAYEKFW